MPRTDQSFRPLVLVSLAGLAGLLACAALAFEAGSPGRALAGGPVRLAIFGAFLVFDLVTIAAGITLAVLRRSAIWSLVPAAAIAAIFLMLFPAFEAFQAVRG